MMPRSPSLETTSRFCVVTRTSPMCPAIRLFLNTLPGSWRWPVEPWLRCETETPWLARSPPKLCRFMTPWKPRPMLMPVTSTNWPGMKCSADSSAPTSRSAFLSTRNSASLRLGSTLAFAKWPRWGLVVFLALREPTPSWTALYLSFSSVRTATTWQLSTLSTVTGTWLPSALNTRDIPSFWAMRPVRMGIASAVQLDVDVDAGGEIELHQRIHGLWRRLDDVEHALVGADLELLARLLVDVRRAQHGEALDAGRQRDRPAHP